MFFPALTGLFLVATASGRTLFGAGVMFTTLLVAVTVGYDLVPDLAVFGAQPIGSEPAPLAVMLVSMLVYLPALAAASTHGRSKYAFMYAFLGAAAAYALTMLINAFGLFGSFQIWAWQVAVAISLFMFCGYKVRRLWGCGVIVSALLVTFLALGYSLNAVQIAVLFVLVAIAAALTYWCLPANNWDTEVIKLAAATKWNCEMWERIEPSVMRRVRLAHTDESLPTFTREDIEFVTMEFKDMSIKLQDQMAEVVLGLINRRWSHEELAVVWNNMIDERDPMLVPESATFKGLRKQHV